MRRGMISVLALAAIGSVGLAVSGAFGPPDCCQSKKGTKVSTKQAHCSATAGFPAMAISVGGKSFDCPLEAKDAAKSGKGKVIFAVSGKEYSSKQEAMTALADSSESYVKRFTTIACVADGKVIYCDGDSSCESKGKTGVSEPGAKKISASSCSSATKVKLAKAGGEDCCASKAKKAKLAKADGATCSGTKVKLAKADGEDCCAEKAKKAKLAKADGATCSGAKVKLAKADGEDCCASKAKKAKLAKADGATPSAIKVKLAKADGKDCCASKAKKAKLAKTDGATPSAIKVKLAKADGKDCCASKVKKAKLAKADGATCSGTKVKLAKADGKDCCAEKAKKTKLAKADGATCSGTKVKLAKAGGEDCCAEKAKKTKLAKADGATCSGSKVKLANADGKDCCADAKEVKYLVVGRTFDSREDAVKARKIALTAMTQIKMTYLVEGEKVDSSDQVCPMAKSAGKVQYVVNKSNTNCEITARVMLAEARYEAAKKSAVKLAKL